MRSATRAGAACSCATPPLTPERMLGGAPDPPIGLLNVPGHGIPRAGRAHPHSPVVRVQDQPIVTSAHEVTLVRREVEADDGLTAFRDGARLALAVARQSR